MRYGCKRHVNTLRPSSPPTASTSALNCPHTLVGQQNASDLLLEPFWDFPLSSPDSWRGAPPWHILISCRQKFCFWFLDYLFALAAFTQPTLKRFIWPPLCSTSSKSNRSEHHEHQNNEMIALMPLITLLLTPKLRFGKQNESRAS